MIDKKITLGLCRLQKNSYKSQKFDDVNVAMRQVALSEKSEAKNFTLYDPSGPYTDQDF